MDPSPSSVMSLLIQSAAGSSGEDIEPSSTLVWKHSLSETVSSSDCLHVYSRHASPWEQVFTWLESDLSNLSHSAALGSSKLPHE